MLNLKNIIISNDVFLTEFKKIVEALYLKDNLDNHLKSVPNNIKLKNKTEYKPNPDWWCIKIPAIRGHIAANGVKDDFYTILSNDKNEINGYILGQYKDLNTKTKNGKKTFFYYFAFNNSQLMYNCFNYLQTDFCRICYYFNKVNSNVFNGGEFKYIPWFDFSDLIFSKSPSEIDDYLFNKYNISDEIRQHIEELLPDYYGIRKG